jgi:hypothetical protein
MGCSTDTGAFVSVEEAAADIEVGTEVEELGFTKCEPGRRNGVEVRYRRKSGQYG